MTTTPTAKKAPTKRKWKFPLTAFFAAIIIIIGVTVFTYPQIASWFDQREQARVLALQLEALRTSPNNDEEYRAQQLALAHEYNDALSSGFVVGAYENKPSSSGAGGNQFNYQELLSAGNEGVMTRLKYDKVGVDLPVYHGTSDEVLDKGLGHLEGTSLPVGGIGTRSVITGHRGLATATMFTNLDKSEIADRFTLETFGEVLTYEVKDIKVIAPEDTEELIADPSRDLVTLVTCTPLGINTHRILVTGERVTPTPIEDLDNAGKVSELPGFPWWTVILGGTVIAGICYVWWSGYPAKPKKPKEKAAGDTNAADTTRETTK